MLVGKHPKRTLVRLAILVVGSFITFKFILLPIRIHGISMQPTYRDGRYNLVNRWAYQRNDPRRGDVVSMTISGPSVMLLKRVIGLPGERVSIRAGVVHINGQPLDEPYVKFPRAPWDEPEIQLKSDEFYVIGDNREMSSDRHEYGRVERIRIVGKVVF